MCLLAIELYLLTTPIEKAQQNEGPSELFCVPCIPLRDRKREKKESK